MKPMDWRRHRWADKTDALFERCVGVSIGAVREHEVLAAHRLDPASRSLLSLTEFLDYEPPTDEGNDCAQVWVENERVVVVEPNGYTGVQHEVATALSTGGRYAAYFWNVNAVQTFIYAVDGVVVREFDPLIYDDDGTPLAEELDLPFPRGGYRRRARYQHTSSAFTLLERLTGFAFADLAAANAIPRPFYLRSPG
jgi:hypothetical protein